MYKKALSLFMIMILAMSLLTVDAVVADENLVPAADFTAEPMIVSSGAHSLVLRSDGTVWAWGLNTSGQLGDGTTINRSVPIQVQGLNNVVTISAGRTSSFAIKNDGTLWAWGGNDRAGLGDGTTEQHHTPIEILDSVVTIAAGGFHAFAQRTDGSLYAWGDNVVGQLGDGTTTNQLSPVRISLDDVRYIFAGGSFSAIIKNDKSLWTWGSNSLGQLGDGTIRNRGYPVRVMEDVAYADLGDYNTLAIRNDASLWRWGGQWEQTASNQISVWARLPFGTPTRIMNNVVAVSAASRTHYMAITNDDALIAWGSNWHGQFGNGTTFGIYANATRIKEGIGVKDVVAGNQYTVALKEDGSLWSWGWNNSGRLGDGTMIDRHTPVQVLGPNGVGYFNVFSSDIPTPPDRPTIGSVEVSPNPAPLGEPVTITANGIANSWRVIFYVVFEDGTEEFVAWRTNPEPTVSYELTLNFEEIRTIRVMALGEEEVAIVDIDVEVVDSASEASELSVRFIWPIPIIVAKFIVHETRIEPIEPNAIYLSDATLEGVYEGQIVSRGDLRIWGTYQKYPTDRVLLFLRELYDANGNAIPIDQTNQIISYRDVARGEGVWDTVISANYLNPGSTYRVAINSRGAANRPYIFPSWTQRTFTVGQRAAGMYNRNEIGEYLMMCCGNRTPHFRVWDIMCLHGGGTCPVRYQDFPFDPTLVTILHELVKRYGQLEIRQVGSNLSRGHRCPEWQSGGAHVRGEAVDVSLRIGNTYASRRNIYNSARELNAWVLPGSRRGNENVQPIRTNETYISDGVENFVHVSVPRGGVRRTATFNSPIDVHIYNSTGQLVGSITGNAFYEVINYDGIDLYILDDVKYVYFFSSDEYTIQISATDHGTMTYTTQDFDTDTRQQTASRRFSDVELYPGREFVSEITDAPEARLFLVENGEIVGEIAEDGTLILRGDVNGDGEKTIADVNALRQYLTGHNAVISRDNADVNADGYVNIVDLTFLRLHLAGRNVGL